MYHLQVEKSILGDGRFGHLKPLGRNTHKLHLRLYIDRYHVQHHLRKENVRIPTQNLHLINRLDY